MLLLGCSEVGSKSDPVKLESAVEELRATGGDWLDVREFPRLTDKDVEALREAPPLKAINLDGTLTGDAAVRLIAEVHPQVGSLSLSETGVTDETLKAVAPLKELHFLRLDKTAVTNEGLKLLPTDFPVRELSLWRNHVTDDGAGILAKLKFLRSLSLDGTGVTDAGLLRLASNPALKELRVSNTKVTAPGVEKFRKARPDVELHAEHVRDDADETGAEE